MDSKHSRKHRGDLYIKKKQKSFRSEIQDGRYGGHLGNLSFASSPERKGHLTQNLVESIGVTCRSKIVKIVPIGNPRWPPWRHLENQFFASSPEPKGQLTRNFVGSIGVNSRSKRNKIIPIKTPRWRLCRPS